jgi:hypothetical protein
MAELYSVRPFVALAGPNGNGYRSEVLVSKGCGTIVAITNDNKKSAQVQISVPVLKKGNLSGWLNKYSDKDGTVPNPMFTLAQSLLESGEPAEFRIEHQRRPKSKSDNKPIDPETPIYELMGADENGKNKNMSMVNENTKKLLTGLARPGEQMLYTQDQTDPAEDPNSGGNYSTSARLNKSEEPKAATSPTPQTHANGFFEVQPWNAINPSGEVNPGSYAVDASLDFYFWVKKYAVEHDIQGLDLGKRVRILAAHLTQLADDLQLAVYNGRLDEPDRSIGSYREVRLIIKQVATLLTPLTSEDVASKDAITNWINTVYDRSLELWKWSIEEYANTVNASPYGD